MNISKDQADPIYYLAFLWKRRWLIAIPTAILVVIVGAVSFALPKVWEVQMLIQPAKFLTQTNIGQYVDVLIIDPRQIATEINQRAFDSTIAQELNLEIEKIPRIKAQHLRDTRIVSVALQETDIGRAKAILQSIYVQIKENLDKKIYIEVNNIDTEIKKNESQIELLSKELAILQNKLSILENREKELLAEIKEARERIMVIEKEQPGALREGGKDKTESLGLLLYANEVQQNLRYINTLGELISEKKMERENLAQRRKEIEKLIESLMLANANLSKMKGRYDLTRLIKEPAASVHPVAPKKKMNILLAGLLGIMATSLGMLFQDYLKRTSDKDKTQGLE